MVKVAAEDGPAKGEGAKGGAAPARKGEDGAAQARASAKPAGRPGAKAEPTPLEALAKTLKAMKPDQAALLLAKVDRPLAVELLRRMKAADAAAVLDKMETGTGAALVAQLAHREAP